MVFESKKAKSCSDIGWKKDNWSIEWGNNYSASLKKNSFAGRGHNCSTRSRKLIASPTCSHGIMLLHTQLLGKKTTLRVKKTTAL